jgi:four helix bundle protein
MIAKGFEELEVWQKARELTKIVYKASSNGEFLKDYGLKNQMCHAAVSTMANIAEGFERCGNREFLQFLAQAKGSCGELRAQLYVALDQDYISRSEFDSLVESARSISRMI